MTESDSESGKQKSKTDSAIDKLSIRVLKSGENLNLFSILFFSISTNVFVCIITNKNSVTEYCILPLEALIFLFSGFYYQRLFKRYEAAKVYIANNRPKDFEQLSNINGLNPDESRVVKRLRDDFSGSSWKHLVKQRKMYFLPRLGYFIGLCLISYNLNISNWFHRTVIASSQTPHGNIELSIFDRFARNHNFYLHQSNFLDTIISKNKIDSCIAIDAFFCYGRVFQKLLLDNNTKKITFKGCYDSPASLSFCRDSLKSVNTNLLSYNNWNKIDSVYNNEHNCKLIYLLNNSLAELADTSEAIQLFTRCYRILNGNGIFVFDFEQTYSPLVDAGSKGYKRVRINESKGEYCRIQYHYYDVARNIDTIVFQRKHCNALMNKAILFRLLSKAGFLDVKFSGRIKGYPFEFVVAKK